MASAIIHLCVAKKINSHLNMNETELSLGAIAPDIAKQIGETKNKSHFLRENESEEIPPHYDLFIKKYKDELNKPFELGYLIHLMTDYYWFRDFIPKMISDYKDSNDLNYISLKTLVYGDYTSLNQRLLDDYQLDLYYFQNEIDYPKSKIDEIPMDKLNILVEKMGLLIQDMNVKRLKIMNYDEIIYFIETCANKILDDLIKLGLVGKLYER